MQQILGSSVHLALLKVLNFGFPTSQDSRCFFQRFTTWKVSKYGVFSGPYFLYSVRIQENTDQKKLRNWALFTQWLVLRYGDNFKLMEITYFWKNKTIQNIDKLSNDLLIIYFTARLQIKWLNLSCSPVTPKTYILPGLAIFQKTEKHSDKFLYTFSFSLFWEARIANDFPVCNLNLNLKILWRGL